MKKKILLIAAVLLALSLPGCGKKEEPVPVEEPTETPVEQEIVVGDEEGKDIIDITKVPKEEWENITWEQIRDFTLAFLPNYREVYGISEDREMAEADWRQMKELMFYQLFGQIYSDYLAVGEVYHDAPTTEEEYGADWIYFEPTEEYLLSLEPDDIAEYFQNFYQKVFGVTPTDNDGNPIRFRDLTDQQLISTMNLFMNQQFHNGEEYYDVDGNRPEKTPVPEEESAVSEEDLGELTEEQAEELLNKLTGGNEG